MQDVESLSQNFKKVNILISESNIEIGTLEGFCIAENPEYNLFPTKQAHITGTKEGNEEKVNAIIDKKYWLDPKDVSAYMLKFEEGGVIAENILDEDGLIRAEKIDGISRILNEEFDRLLDIEIQNS